MIGTKLYKNNKEDMKQYTQTAIWCNKNNAHIEDKGSYYEVVENQSPTLEELKEVKHQKLKSIRDAKEIEPINVNNYLFDFDQKASDRINFAITALEISGSSINWTLADNTTIQVNAEALKEVVAAVAQRSNALHIKYRELITQLEACTTKEQVSEIKWE